MKNVLNNLNFVYLLYKIMSGFQTTSQGSLMLPTLPKSDAFQVRCESNQMLVTQQFVVKI